MFKLHFLLFSIPCFRGSVHSFLRKKKGDYAEMIKPILKKSNTPKSANFDLIAELKAAKGGASLKKTGRSYADSETSSQSSQGSNAEDEKRVYWQLPELRTSSPAPARPPRETPILVKTASQEGQDAKSFWKTREANSLPNSPVRSPASSPLRSPSTPTGDSDPAKSFTGKEAPKLKPKPTKVSWTQIILKVL